MKIALISSSFPEAKPGGVPTYVEGRAYYLARRMDVRVFAWGLDYPASRHNFQAVSLGNMESMFKSAFRIWWKLVRELRAYKPDVVEIHNIPMGLPILLFFWVLGLPRPRYFFHGPARLEARIEGAGRITQFFYYSLEYISLRMSRKIFTDSHAFFKIMLSEHRFLRNKPKRARVHTARIVVPAAAELARIETPPALSFVCVRRLVRRTGVLELVEAFIQAQNMGKLADSTVLNIVGQGPLYAEIEARIAAAGAQVQIILHGRLASEERDELYRTSSYNVLPTIGLEGFGLVVLEAAFFGCPSLVTEVNALPEVVAMLENHGVICAPTVDAIRQALIEAKQPSLSERTTLAALAKKKFGVHI
jgi:glycosyltransferase involved in cell wall biosynthesis